MLRVQEAVPRIQELLRSTPGDIEVVAWDSGDIEAVPRRAAEQPEQAPLPGEPRVIAKFLPQHMPLSDQEIEDQLHTGLAGRRETTYRSEPDRGPASP